GLWGGGLALALVTNHHPSSSHPPPPLHSPPLSHLSRWGEPARGDAGVTGRMGSRGQAQGPHPQPSRPLPLHPPAIAHCDRHHTRIVELALTIPPFPWQIVHFQKSPIQGLRFSPQRCTIGKECTTWDLSDKVRRR